jgi:glycosyltransferase involved in cell wall biosynthesis
MSRPDVALVAPYPRLGNRHEGASGVASYTANLAHALTDAGAAVTVLAPAEAGEPEDGNDGGVHVRRAYGRGVRAVWDAAAAACDAGAPVVHLQHELFLYGGPASVPALPPALARLRRGPARTVVTMHQVVDPAGVDEAFVKQHRVKAPAAVARAGLSAVQETLRRLADAVVVHEPSFAEVVADAHVIPHGLETVEGRPRTEARARLGLEQDAFVALAFGFLAPYKGLEPALEAARRLGDEVQLVVAGGAHPRLAESGDRYADELQAAYGGDARFTGYVPDEQVHDWFAAADVALLLYPKPFSSSGALALALAHGTPVLMSEALAASIDVPDDCALHCTVPTEPEAVAARLGSLRRDRDLLERLAGCARRLGRDRGWPQVAQRHLEIYGGAS